MSGIRIDRVHLTADHLELKGVRIGLTFPDGHTVRTPLLLPAKSIVSKQKPEEIAIQIASPGADYAHDLVSSPPNAETHPSA